MAALVQRSANIPLKDPQTRHGEASGSGSGGKEKGSNEGKKKNPLSRRENSDASNESGAPHTVKTGKKDKNDPKSKGKATQVVAKPSPENPYKEEDGGDKESDEGERSEEDDEEDKAKREALLAEGREESLKLRRGETSSARPERIEKLWRSLYTQMKTWWTSPTKELNSQQRNTIETIHGKIKRECKRIVDDQNPNMSSVLRDFKTEEMLRKYEFPHQTLHGLISSTAAALKHLEEHESDEANGTLDDQQNALVDGVAVITEVLKQHQIPVPCVVTQNAVEMFGSIVNRNEQSKERYANTITELNKPIAEQRQAWTVAIPEMEKALEVMKGAGATSGKRQLEAHIGTIESQNKVLEDNNVELGLTATMNSLPIALLKRMQEQWIGNQQGELANSWTDLVKTLGSQSLAKTLHEKLDTQQKGKAKATGDGSSSSNSTDPPQTSSGEHVPPSAGEATIADRSNRPTPEASASEKDYLSMKFSELDVISIPDYSSGVTEFGKLAAVRLSHTSNPKFSRFIVKAGTSDVEYYQVIRGTDLGPGGAEALQDCDDESFHSRFDLWKRKTELKENKITRIGPCVVMSRAEDFTPGPRTRRPDTYVKISYGDGSIDWATRTELIQFVGKKFAERKLVTLEAVYKEKTKFLEAHKKAGIHPDTKQPLDLKDYESTPWLFPEGGLPGGIDAEGTENQENEEGDNMDDIQTNT